MLIIAPTLQNTFLMLVKIKMSFICKMLRTMPAMEQGSSFLRGNCIPREYV